MSSITISEIDFNKIKLIENVFCLESHPPQWELTIVWNDNTKRMICLSDDDYMTFTKECNRRGIAIVTNIW